MYKFITVDEYNESYKHKYPNARQSPDESEYVISTIDGDVTHDEAVAYIESNWREV